MLFLIDGIGLVTLEFHTGEARSGLSPVHDGTPHNVCAMYTEVHHYLQVVLTVRQLLCLPSTALAALVQHEAAHHHALVAAQLREVSDHTAQLEAKAQHQQQLRPVLAQPACRADLEAIQSAEDARWRLEVETWTKLMQDARIAVPQAAFLSQQRLAAAAKQLAELLSKFPMPEDLVPASSADTSLDGIPALNMLQLERWELAMAEIQASPASNSTGRPFSVVNVALTRAAVSAEHLGWSPAHTKALEDACASIAELSRDANVQDLVQDVAPAANDKATRLQGKGEGSTGAAGTTTAANMVGVANHGTDTAESISSIDTPVFRALMRAHQAAAADLSGQFSSDMKKMLSVALEQIKQARSWRHTWNLMLSRLGIPAADTL
jgi:hypothetical protein